MRYSRSLLSDAEYRRQKFCNRAMQAQTFASSFLIPVTALANSIVLMAAPRHKLRYLPNIRSLFFVSGGLLCSLVTTALAQKNMNEHFIKKYLDGYSEDQLRTFDMILMDRAIARDARGICE